MKNTIMSEVFVLIDNYAGTPIRYFTTREDAKEARRALRVKLHTDHCINKHVPDKCACGTPRVMECASHHYARTVAPHSVRECTIASEVIIDDGNIE